MQQYSLLPENKHSLKQTWIALKGKKERVRFFHYMGSPFVPMFNHWDSRFAGVLSYAKCLPLSTLPALSDNLLVAYSGASMDLTTKDHSTKLSTSIS
jgi:hypothetical protein